MYDCLFARRIVVEGRLLWWRLQQFPLIGVDTVISKF
jgi:hypothetical protein